MFARIKEEISVVFDRDPVARSVFEVVTTYPASLEIVIFLTLLCGMIAGALIATLMRFKPSAKTDSPKPPPGMYCGKLPQE